MATLRSTEGYLRIDHRESPGIADAPFHSRGQLFEAPTATCSHCQAIVVMNPGRTRTRAYCPKCDHYICDVCEAERVRTGVCKPFKQVIDEFTNAAAKGLLNGT